ncbi:MAG: flagellar motor protein MotB [Geminicoccaceae bacterium]|nr:OmpA family protein [Geminicoccaceae bacterium]
MSNQQAPVIIKKVIEEGGHGHHGGAWKVAYADFVTAMMAFFLMLWLLSTSSEETLQGLAQYFSEADANEGEPGGVGGILDGTTVTSQQIVIQAPSSPFSMPGMAQPSRSDEDADAFEMELSTSSLEMDSDLAGMSSDEALRAAAERLEDEQFETANAAIVQQLNSTPELAEYADSLQIDKTEDGLRIQIVDQARTAMFPGGSAEMFDHTKKLIDVVVRAIANLPQKLSIRGHTDSRPFAPGVDNDNWRLSSARANATRQALVNAGLDPRRIAEVVGKADSEHLLEEAPNDPRNRRISLVLLRNHLTTADDH